jgi:chemotaxis protein CheD
VSHWSDVVTVRLGELAVAKDQGRLAALGLGSCVAVILYDAMSRVGAMAHVVLPSRDDGRPGGVAKYADQAVPALAEEMRKAGANLRTTTAKLVGGATMFASLVQGGVMHLGQRNVESCRQALRGVGLHTIAEETGEEYGRSVVMDVSDGSVMVRSVGRGEKRV